MAGIEKICEYSGEYPGGAMYRYKRDLIQIMPKYRKLFKGKRAYLFVFEPWTRSRFDFWCHRKTWWLTRTSRWHISIPRFWDPRFWSKFRYKYRTYKVDTWDYALVVPELPGEVGGVYTNWTCRPLRMFRKINKLVGGLLLECVFTLNFTEEEWRQKLYREVEGATDGNDALCRLVQNLEAEAGGDNNGA